MELDFGAIGKGIALDAASVVLDAYGLNRHLINFDGEILAGDTPPGKDSWQITILPTGTEETLIIDAVRASIATSGGVNQFFELGGVRYSHIIDPSTGIGTSCARHRGVRLGHARRRPRHRWLHHRPGTIRGDSSDTLSGCFGRDHGERWQNDEHHEDRRSSRSS